MTYPSKLDVSRRVVPGAVTVGKFGRNPAVGTSAVPICEGGIYRTPQVGGATALRVKAGGNANDAAAGSGARSIRLIGLDAEGYEIEEVLDTAGASASAASAQSFLRLYRYLVETSGTYATASSGSHVGNIVIEDAAGTEDWATISAVSFPRGQSKIGVYTVPKNKAAYIDNIQVSVEGNKSANILLFQRQAILEGNPPYHAMRLLEEHTGISGPLALIDKSPKPIPELTDVGFMAYTSSGTVSVSVAFDMLVFDEPGA